MPPPYTDHHVHLMATAAARLSIDVSAAGSLSDLGRLVGHQAGERPGGWLRAWGYEEWRLVEHRHPTRDDLDSMVGDRPLVLHHRTGHAAVLNTRALEGVGQPGHPDGILVDRHDLLARAPRLPPADLEAAVAAVSREWEAAGVGSVMDATHTNGPEQLERMAAWRAAGVLRQEVTAMVAPAHAAEMARGAGRVGPVRVGPVKLMPTAGRLEELPHQVEAAHALGFAVAVHVVDVEVLDAVLDAFARSAPPPGVMDRIEHNALSLPEQVTRIAAYRVLVVVNPAFLTYRAGKYRTELAPVEWAWLIRIGSLLRAGVAVRAGSDAPVGPARPDQMVVAAMSHPFAAAESVSREEAEALLAP